MTFKMIVPVAISNTELVSSTVSEDDFGEWASGTTYADGDKVIVIGTTHAIFESVQASNTGNDPVTDDGTWWVNIGSTNRWKAFDQYIGDPTIQAASVQWVLQSATTVDSVALFGLVATSITIVGNVSGSEVYSKTFDMNDKFVVGDWYDYYFVPLSTKASLIVTDIPPYTNMSLTITVQNPSSNVKVGQLVIGRKVALGKAINNVPLGIEDFSRKEQDIFGRFQVIERDFTNLVTVTFVYPTGRSNWLLSQLAARRASATVYAVDSRYEDNDYAAYGFFSNFQPIARYAEISEAVIELESLT
jgi:hypothetical protein